MEPVNNNGHPRTGVRYSQVDYNKSLAEYTKMTVLMV